MDNLKDDHLKVIQISDTHLFEDDQSTLFGVNSNLHFHQLIDHIRQNELHDTDLLVLTGDLSQDETTGSYEVLVKALDPLNIPIYWIPGNHDNIEKIEAVFKTGNNFFSSRRLSTKHWNFIFLNTKLEGTADGFLDDTELQALASELSKVDQKPTAIVMHHHPAKVDTPLIDQYILRNASEFWNIVTGTQAKLVICGHVHQDYKIKHNDVAIESSPASCFQFPKKTQELVIEEKIGCKIYHFNEQGFQSQAKWYSE